MNDQHLPILLHKRPPPAFQAAISQPGFANATIPFPSHPSLYQVMREDRGDAP
jgi:hypothetical protein